MTNRLDQLEKRGLIRREPQDRRALAVHLTEPGKAVARTAFEATREEAERFLSPLSPQEARTLDALLQKLLPPPAPDTAT